MHNPVTFGKPHRPSRTRDRLVLWLTILLSVASLIVAGALGAAVRTGGTGGTVLQYAFGVIEAVPTIVVNGVTYDDSHANIILNGVPHQPRSVLKGGMIAGIDGEFNYATGTGTASILRANRAIRGQVESINAANGELRVLSQRVATDATTRFDGTASLAQLVPGDWIDVHGLDDPARNVLVSSLIERVTTPVPAVAEIRGVVRNAQAGGFRIGGLKIISAASGIEDDTFVAVRGTYDARAAALTATEVVMMPEVEIHEHVDSAIEGFIADFRSSKDFTVAGVAIDASSARYENGTAKDLKPGVRITVEGVVRNGVLVADEVEIHGDQVDAGASGVTTESSVEVEGIISQFRAIDNFVVRGRQIDASNASISGKHAPATGLKAHVEGKLAADGIVKASRITIEKP